MGGTAGRIYLDHMASTPLDPAVLDAMLPWMRASGVGNPHSAHPAGWQAADAVEEARARIAALIGARPEGIVFTSGGTEANNLALLGGAPEGWAVAVSAIEHPSVLACLPELSRRGRRTHVLPVDGDGLVDLGALERVLGDGPALVSVMAANNETGVLQPMEAIARLCRGHGALFHTDASQLLATGALDMGALGIDLLTVSGHKLYGPMGIGALAVRPGIAVSPLLFGGGQQGGRRPGTLPVPLCIGLGVACDLARARRDADSARLQDLRERLFTALAAAIPTLRRNAPAGASLPGCLNVTIPGIDAADLLLDLPELVLSTGSACASGSGKPSHVLAALGLRPEDIHGSLRFGLGRGTTEAEIDHAAARLTEAVQKPGL